MANPLSQQGVSDKDYAAAIGTMVGEAKGQGVKGMAAVGDVLANRQENGYFSTAYGTGIADQAKARNGAEFNAWMSSEKTNAAQVAAKQAERAVLDKAYRSTLSSSMQKALDQAEQAAFGVWGSKDLRGVTQGATFYQNKGVTDDWGTSGPQDKMVGKYGSVQIGDHTFTGPGFDAGSPFNNTNLDKNWTGYQNSFNGLGEQERTQRAMQNTRQEWGDISPGVWDGTWSNLNDLAAPVAPVERQDLPDLSPSISSDSTGLGWSPDNTGWGRDFDTSPAASPSYGDLGYRDTSPAPSYSSPSYGDLGYRDTSPSFSAPSAPSSSPDVGAYSFGQNFNTTPMASAGSLQPSLGSLSNWSGDETGAPTANPYGAPAPQAAAPAPSLDNLGISLPPEVGTPDFSTVAPSMPTPTVNIDGTARKTAPAAPALSAPVFAAPKPIAPPVAPKTFAPAPQTPQEAAPSFSAPPDFSSAFNGLWGPNAAQNRQSFSGLSGLDAGTVNALTSAYDNAGALTAWLTLPYRMPSATRSRTSRRTRCRRSRPRPCPTSAPVLLLARGGRRISTRACGALIPRRSTVSSATMRARRPRTPMAGSTTTAVSLVGFSAASSGAGPPAMAAGATAERTPDCASNFHPS
jgi:hypothetical protein